MDLIGGAAGLTGLKNSPNLLLIGNNCHIGGIKKVRLNQKTFCPLLTYKTD